MGFLSKFKRHQQPTAEQQRKEKAVMNSDHDQRRRMTWDIPVFFGIIFALSVAELCFTIDAFVYLQKKHKWWSGTEKARMGFLIFSCVRTIFLSATYVFWHCLAKSVLSLMHTIFCVFSCIFWVISGVLIYQIWTYVECQNNGIPDDFQQFKSQVSGGLSLCHEIKTIEIIAWVIAAVSVVAVIPVVRTYLQMRKEGKTGHKGSGFKIPGRHSRA